MRYICYIWKYGDESFSMDIFCVSVAMIWIGVHDIVTDIFPRQIFDGSLIWKFRPNAVIKRLVLKYGSINAAIDELF